MAFENFYFSKIFQKTIKLAFENSLETSKWFFKNLYKHKKIRKDYEYSRIIMYRY